MKIIKFAITTVAPVGVAMKYDATKPKRKAKVDTIAAPITTPLKVWQKRMAVRVGKIIRLEIRSEPSKRMPSTITTEQITAKIAS